MNLEEIIAILEQERDRLNAAIEALSGSERKGGRPPKRHLSAAARRKISLAQKKRWAERKKG